MRKLKVNGWCLPLAVLAVLVLPEMVQAQNFAAKTGDLLLGVRVTPGSHTANNYELVVNLGSVTNYLAMPAGTSTNLNQFSPARLTDAFNGYTNLQWSVGASINAPFAGYWSGFFYETIWFTQPRGIPGAQTSPPARASGSAQSGAESKIYSIANGAVLISGNLGTTGPNNTVNLVREPYGYGSYDYATFVADPTTPALGDYQGQWINVENTTPASFTAAVVSDLYQSVPNNFVDPTTGTSSGPAYYVGYFTLNTDGTMTFTRASINAQPPAPAIVSLTRSVATSTVFFTTTNGTFTYTLYFTNASGLSDPATNWSALPTTIVGNGLTNNLSDTTTDTNRFYRVGVQ